MDGKRKKKIIKTRHLFAALFSGLILIPAGACYAKEYYLVPRLVHSSHVLRLGDFIADLGRDESDRLPDPFPLHLESPSLVSADVVRKALEDTGRRDFILVGTHCLFVPDSGKAYQDNYFPLLDFLREELAVEGGWAEVSAEPEHLEKITDQTVFLSVEEKPYSYAGYSSRFRHPTHTVRFRNGGSAAIDTAEITIQRYVSGLKAVRRIEANRKIKTGDVRQGYVAWNDKENPPAQMDMIENGCISKTALSQGEAIFIKNIKKETLMESGSRISIYIKKGTITMRLEGVVYGSGGLHDRVRVKPVRADRSLYGRIISPREVVVEGL